MARLNDLKEDDRFGLVRENNDGVVTCMLYSAYLGRSREILRDEYDATITNEEQGAASGNRIATVNLPDHDPENETVETDMDAEEAISMF